MSFLGTTSTRLIGTDKLVIGSIRLWTKLGCWDGKDCREKTFGLYVARIGFSSSIRPGDGSLLLNVNPVTSAFYPTDWSLHKWIWQRWTSLSDPEENKKMHKELKGLKVIFKGDAKKKIRTISGFSNNPVEKHNFTKRGGTVQTNVYKHMVTG